MGIFTVWRLNMPLMIILKELILNLFLQTGLNLFRF